MNIHEWGIALLCTVIPGDGMMPLTMAQLRTLSRRVSALGAPDEPMQELRPEILERLGYSSDQAQRICALLSRETQLERYLDRAREHGIFLLTRLSADYPPRLHHLLRLYAPPVLFAAGDVRLLSCNGVGVVGSRALRPMGAQFARRVGQLAAIEGLNVISGNALGTDRTAQEACIRFGGSVVSFVADELTRHLPGKGESILMLSEGGYDLPFSNPRALHRNHLIHALGEKTFVAQCDLGFGGTWAGTMENLRHSWSEVYVCNDGSEAMAELVHRGATAVDMKELYSLEMVTPDQRSFFDKK